MAYALTKDPTLPLADKILADPTLAIASGMANPGNATPQNVLLSKILPNSNPTSTLAFALTGDATTAYASTLDNPVKAVLAEQIAPANPILTQVLTKDPVLTLGALKEQDPNSPFLAYAAAQTGDAAIASALTGDPAVAYASQTNKPGLAGLAAAAEKPGLAYIATK